MIESRYTIEYVNPESKGDSGTKKSVALFAFLGLILATALAYAFFAITKSNDFVRTSEKAQNQPLEITDEDDDDTSDELASMPALSTTTMPTPKKVTSTSLDADKSLQKKIEKPLLNNKKQENKPTAQIDNNEKLNTSINNLTKQLMAEREKSKSLDKRLSLQKNQNNQLSELLENALFKASSTDKNYLSALTRLDKKTDTTKSKKLIIKEKTIAKREIDSKIKITASQKQNTNKTDNYNSVSLSTNSQVDAIIAAMQGKPVASPKPKVIKNNVDKTNEVKLASVSQTNPTELLHIRLQKQINQLIEKNNTSPISNETYTKALEKESKIRKNAVRSITIKKGETLWAIAQRAYGNGSLYKKIIEANPQTNMKKLYVGQVIRVPN